MKIKRRKARVVRIGNIRIGGNNPVAIQSMAKTSASDIAATIKEIKELQSAGCKIVRLAVRDNQDVKNLRKIKQRISIPLVADIHFDKNLALQAIDSGIDKIRLNPGNIYQPKQVREIAQAAKQAHIPIRVGVNSGSVMSYPLAAKRKPKNLAQLMVDCALDYTNLLENAGFRDIVISLKGSDIFTTIQANEIIARSCSYPLHLGVTATGPRLIGIIKSAMVIGRLLSGGIGDTIRISLTDRAVEEVKAAVYILQALGLETSQPEIISCPTCGRCRIDLVKMVKELELGLAKRQIRHSFGKPIKIAVMGCLVNGPGEARQADLGVAFGQRQGLLFRKGKPSSKVSVEKCIDILLEEISKTCFGQRHLSLH
ncbi:MAG: flavodoxin-dependent (E)-4-hydroxy-3-methylbut-2-enyl-diphosphate synthase [Candidatus Omnitrophota bacterium]